MNINKSANGTELTMAIVGRLDTVTAPEFEAELKASIGGVESLILDLAELEYTSSAGLRIILMAQKIMNKQGKMIVKKFNFTGSRQNIRVRTTKNLLNELRLELIK